MLVYIFFSFFLFFSFSSYVEFFFFLIRFLFYFVLLSTISFSLTASFTCLFCTRGLFLLSCTHVSFPAGFFFLAPLYPFLFLLFCFFTLFFKGCSCSLSENLFVLTGLASSLFTLFLFIKN